MFLTPEQVEAVALVATGTDVPKPERDCSGAHLADGQALRRVQAVGLDKQITSETCSGSARRVTSPNPSSLKGWWGGSPLSSS